MRCTWLSVFKFLCCWFRLRSRFVSWLLHDRFRLSLLIAENPSTRAEESKSDAGVSKPISRTIAEALASAGTTLEEAEAELVLSPLRLAFETKNGKIAELALDFLHKLIAYDHLEGDTGLDGGKNAPLFTDILNMICSCVDNALSDSTILQVLKVLLTAVASARFRVHGESLLGVIRVCYNIALSSKSPINQATSKAMLTQMISIVFRRMESDLSAMKPEVHGSSLSDKDMKGTASGDALDSSQANNTSLASLEELHNLAGGANIKGLEAVLDKAVNLEDGDKMKQGIDLESMSISQRDALLVFRTLCKEDTDDVTTKTRILSLELLQQLPKQTNNTDCGYYVLRFMLDIMTRRMDNPLENFTTTLGSTPLSKHKVDEVREQWVRFVQDYILVVGHM